MNQERVIQVHNGWVMLVVNLAIAILAIGLFVGFIVTAVEAAPSVEAAADTQRPLIELPGAVRWTWRRVRMVRRFLTTLIGLMPGRFASCQPTLASFRAALSALDVLVTLRAIAAADLAQLAVPVGFDHRCHRGHGRRSRCQQRAGPDPPPDPGDGRS